MKWMFRFEAAHSLPNVPEGHKCKRVHGHSYQVELVVAATTDAEGKERAAGVFETLSHRYLNEVEGLENPTAEHIAAWLWRRLRADVAVEELRIFENPDSVCVYRGE